jgi:hypothetical protein
VSAPSLPADSDPFGPDDAGADRDGLGGQAAEASGIRVPMEAHTPYRSPDWSPQRLMFHQNLESFAERVGLLVGLQSNGKVSQEQAYAEIRKLWKELKDSRGTLLSD